MLRQIIYFLLLLLPLMLQGQQQYFNKRYDFNKGIEIGFGILPYDSGYVGAFSAKNSGSPIRLIIGFLDSVGSNLQVKVYNKTNTHIYSSSGITPLSDNGYAIATSTQYSLSDYRVILFRFKHNGDTLWSKEYGDTLFRSGWQCKQTREGGFIIVGQNGVNDPLYNNNILLIKTDSLGNLEWEKHYGGAGTDLGISIDTCFDGGFIICGNTTSYGVNALSTFPNCYLIKTDSLGNFQWQKTFGIDYGDDFTSVVQGRDSSIIVGGEFAFYDPYAHCCGGYYRPYIVKLDLSGNVIWEKTYGDSLPGGISIKAIKELANGDIIAAGVGFDTINHVNRGLVLKVKSNGDSIFYHNYATLGLKSLCYFYDISPDKDNGFICTGAVVPVSPDTGTQDIWVLKLDSNGCEIWNCLMGVGINELNAVPENVINIYPNPSNGLFHIRNNGYDEIEKTEIFNYTGEIIFYSIGRTETMDLSNAASGIYFYSIQTKGGNVFNGKILKE